MGQQNSCKTLIIGVHAFDPPWISCTPIKVLQLLRSIKSVLGQYRCMHIPGYIVRSHQLCWTIASWHMTRSFAGRLIASLHPAWSFAGQLIALLHPAWSFAGQLIASLHLARSFAGQLLSAVIIILRTVSPCVRQ